MTDTAARPVTRGEVSALILAAGSGTRLGQSKAFLECAGKTLLERVVERAAMFADEVVVGLSSEDLGRVPPSVEICHLPPPTGKVSTTTSSVPVSVVW